MSTTETTTTIPPHVPADLVHEFDFYEMAGEWDLYERYRKLHELPDIFYTPSQGGHWVVQRYEDQDTIFENTEVFSSRQQTIPPAPNGQFGMVMFDGEKHLAYRKLLRPTLIQPFLKPTEHGEKLDAYIQQVCVGLIEGMIDKGECEFFGEFATKLPMTVVMKALVDLPMEDAPKLEELTEAVARAGGDQEKFYAAFAGLAQYFLEEIIPEKRANPGNDTISAIVHGQPEGRPLTDMEIIAECSLVIIGGLDTVSAALAFTAWHLAEHPGHRQRLIAEPEIIPAAVEEYLRRFGIVNMCRHVTRDVDYGGVIFKEGDLVFVPSTAACIDEKHYPNPFEVDFDRADKKHLTFHSGPHTCVGALVARRELRIFLEEWLKRIPDFRVKPGTQLQMMTGLGNRFVELPLEWDMAEDVEPGAPWITEDQRDLDTLATALMDHPEVKAARAIGLARYQGYPELATKDGPSTVNMAIDNLMFGCLQLAANDDATRPRLVWTARMPYTLDGRRVHDSRYGGDVADRAYRNIGVRPEHRYEISGRRHPTHPSVNDFSFEAVPPPGLWGQPTRMIQAPDDIDVDDDGTFTITLDGMPADGRRNHLELPPGTVTIFVRDTLQDWAGQVPNEVNIRLVGGEPEPPRSDDEVAQAGISMFNQCLESARALFANTLRSKAKNAVTPFLRPIEWGVGGGLLSANNFDLADDEALLITMDPMTAAYMSIAVADPWMSSAAYDVRSSTFNNLQAQPNDDGAFTFALAVKDPGIHNWLDTAGMRTGIILARWERFEVLPESVAPATEEEAEMWTPRATVDEAVRETRLIKVDEVASAIPPGQSLVSPDERKNRLAARLAAYQVRVTGQPISGGQA